MSLKSCNEFIPPDGWLGGEASAALDLRWYETVGGLYTTIQAGEQRLSLNGLWEQWDLASVTGVWP